MRVLVQGCNSQNQHSLVRRPNFALNSLKIIATCLYDYNIESHGTFPIFQSIKKHPCSEGYAVMLMSFIPVIPVIWEDAKMVLHTPVKTSLTKLKIMCHGCFRQCCHAMLLLFQELYCKHDRFKIFYSISVKKQTLQYKLAAILLHKMRPIYWSKLNPWIELNVRKCSAQFQCHTGHYLVVWLSLANWHNLKLIKWMVQVSITQVFDASSLKLHHY